MSHNLKQGAGSASVAAAAFHDDASGNNSLHMMANARILTTVQFKITQTSPGIVTGIGGNTSLAIPGGAVPCGIRFYANTGANTAATITIGIDTTSTYFLNGAAVSTNGQHFPTTQALNLFAALAGVPNGFAHTITGFYAETATSATGTIVTGEIDYYVPIPS